MEETKKYQTPINIFVEGKSVFSYLHFYESYNLIEKVKVVNSYFLPFSSLTLKIYTLNNEYLKVDDIFIPLLKEKEEISLTSFNIKFDKEKLKNIVLAKDIRLYFEIINENNEILVSSFFNIKLISPFLFSLSFFDYPSLSSFITPNNKYIKNLAYNSKIKLKELYNFDNFFNYQNYDLEDIYNELEILYNEFKKLDVSLVNLPINYLINGIKIRRDEEIYFSKRGTELDLALFFSGLIEYFLYSPLLIFSKNNVMIGIWTTSNISYSPLLTSKDDISLYLSINKIIPLSITSIFNKKAKFKENILETKKYLLNEEDILLLDIKACRKNHYYPLEEDILNKEDIDKIAFNKESLSLKDVNLKSSEIKNEFYKNKDRFSYWERKLLDLSKNNKLINMKIGTNNFQVLTSSIYDLSYILMSNLDNRFTLLFKNDENIPSSSKKHIYEIKNDLKIKNRCDEFILKNKLEVLLNEKEYFTSLPSLYRKVYSEEEETGSNTLFIAFGVVTWKENFASKSTFNAPILLLPIEIKKNKSKLFEIKALDQEPFLNTSFLAYLKDEFALDLQFSNDLPRKSDNVDVIDLNKIISEFKKNLLSFKGFKISETAFIGRFSFSKYIMWNDIRNRKNEMLKNPIIKSFLNGKKERESPKKFDASDIDNFLNLKNVAIPLSSDSSQIEAIINSSNGQSFVMIGPPGTGKSQTITNIIVNALYNNKKVLFCSEKKAALDVVYSRLKEVKVDPFCLELHSNKQDKKNVLSSLEKVLELGEIAKKKEFSSLIDNINYLKNDFKEIIKKVHFKNAYPLSLYDAILKFEKYKDEKGEEFFISDQFIDNFTKTKEENIDNLFIKGQTYQKAFNEFKENNPFFIVELRDYSLQVKNDLKSSLQLTIDEFEKFIINYKKLNKSLKIENLDDKIISQIYNLFDYLKVEEVYFNLLNEDSYLLKLKKLKDMILLENDFVNERSSLRRVFDESIEKNDFKQLYLSYENSKNSNFLKKFFTQTKILRELKKKSFNPKEINKNNLEKYLVLLKKHNLNKPIINKNSILIESLIPSDYFRNDKNDYNKILNKIGATIDFSKIIEKISYGKLDNKLFIKYIYELYEEKASKETIENYQSGYEIIKDNLFKLSSIFKFNFNKFKNGESITNLFENLKEIYNHIDLLQDWCELLNIFDCFDNYSLKNIKDEYLKCLDFNSISKRFYKALYKRIIEKLINKNHLEKFNGENLNLERISYQKLDNTYKKDVINEVVAKLSSSLPISYKNSVNSSEVGILKKAIKSNGRGMSLRKILSLISETLLNITPCILVSPLSCAKYLDPELYHFDLIIFDEASQIPTSSAIGVISRGDSLLIAGDDKQLPPTSFFDKQANDDEDELFISDLESILDDAIAASFPIKKLLYHYRSKNESLIAFSNNKFYNNELYTFPSIDDVYSKVHFKFVNGTYDLGRSATNIEEAKAIINDLIFRIKNDNFNHSFGVITFSIHQMELIQKMLEENIEKDKELFEKVSSLNEPIFVKNLENVQGDERDIIYLSICYGRDKNGRFVQNFGPINNLGGYRRLNVAITRSREEMYVYSSITYNEINLSKTNSQGVKYLKEFLEYAQYGIKTLTSSSSSYLIKEGVENYLAADLKIKGYEVVTHLGTSKFKIDIAIVNPNNKNKYLLAIIMDSYSYISTPTVEDRNIIQFNKLSSLGWKVLMVWTLDYFNNRTKVLKVIDDEIKKALDENASSNTYLDTDFSSLSFKKVEKKEESALKPYLIFTLKNLYNEKQFLNPKNRKKIYKIIKNIIDVEYPISKSILIKKIYYLFQIKRKNRENSELTNYFIAKLNNPNNYSYYVDNIFYFKDGMDDFKIDFYRKADDRNIEDIPKEEIEVLIIELLKRDISIEKESLKKEIVKKFGFKSKTKKIDDCLEFVINYMIKDKNEIKLNKNNYLELTIK